MSSDILLPGGSYLTVAVLQSFHQHDLENDLRVRGRQRSRSCTDFTTLSALPSLTPLNIQVSKRQEALIEEVTEMIAPGRNMVDILPIRKLNLIINLEIH